MARVVIAEDGEKLRAAKKKVLDRKNELDGLRFDGSDRA